MKQLNDRRIAISWYVYVECIMHDRLLMIGMRKRVWSYAKWLALRTIESTDRNSITLCHWNKWMHLNWNENFKFYHSTLQWRYVSDRFDCMKLNWIRISDKCNFLLKPFRYGLPENFIFDFKRYKCSSYTIFLYVFCLHSTSVHLVKAEMTQMAFENFDTTILEEVVSSREKWNMRKFLYTNRGQNKCDNNVCNLMLIKHLVWLKIIGICM